MVTAPLQPPVFRFRIIPVFVIDVLVYQDSDFMFVRLFIGLAGADHTALPYFPKYKRSRFLKDLGFSGL